MGAEKSQIPQAGIQWKGTDVCFDFYCICGVDSHFDGYHAYYVRCGHCGRTFRMPLTVELVEATGSEITADPVVTSVD